MEHILLAYLLLINIVAFVLYGVDKLKAKNSRRRISEATLLFVAIIGGSVGAWCGMKVWHHKTLHKKFRYGLPAIFLLHLALCVIYIIG